MAIEGFESLVAAAARHAWVSCPEGLKQGRFVGEEVVDLKFWLIRRGWGCCWVDVVRRVVGTFEVIWVQESASILLGGGWATLV